MFLSRELNIIKDHIRFMDNNYELTTKILAWGSGLLYIGTSIVAGIYVLYDAFKKPKSQNEDVKQDRSPGNNLEKLFNVQNP